MKLNHGLLLVIGLSVAPLPFAGFVRAGSVCGTNGSAAERIKDCRETKTSKKGYEFKLVARIVAEGLHQKGEFFELWKDVEARVYWGDIIAIPGKSIADSRFPFQWAQKACLPASISANRAVEDSIAAVIDREEDLIWALPTGDELYAAMERGIGEIIPHIIGFKYWASSNPLLPGFLGSTRYAFGATVFDLDQANTTHFGNPELESHSIRCIGKRVSGKY